MRGTLNEGEAHPAAHEAMKWVSKNYPNPLTPEGAIIRESMASCAIENNRLAELSLETLRRLDKGEPVSDRYLLGLAWFLRDLKEGA